MLNLRTKIEWAAASLKAAEEHKHERTAAFFRRLLERLLEKRLECLHLNFGSDMRCVHCGCDPAIAASLKKTPRYLEERRHR